MTALPFVCIMVLMQRDKMKRDAAEGEVIGLRQSAKNHAHAAYKADKRGMPKLAQAERDLAEQFKRMADEKAAKLR